MKIKNTASKLKIANICKELDAIEGASQFISKYFSSSNGCSMYCDQISDLLKNINKLFKKVKLHGLSNFVPRIANIMINLNTLLENAEELINVGASIQNIDATISSSKITNVC